VPKIEFSLDKALKSDNFQSINFKNVDKKITYQITYVIIKKEKKLTTIMDETHLHSSRSLERLMNDPKLTLCSISSFHLQMTSQLFRYTFALLSSVPASEILVNLKKKTCGKNNQQIRKKIQKT